MTLDFYRLTEQPFEASPDPRFLYMGGSHRQALASLLQALQADRGFVTLLANPGLGKTTLLFHTIKSFGDKVATVYVRQAAQSPLDLLRAILVGLGVRDTGENVEETLTRLTEILLEEHRLGKRVIVLIDEAEKLDASVFGILCTLSNHESPRGSLIQFIFCGQPRLSEKLAAIKPMQAMARGAVVRLEPFSAQDTAQYVEHRLRTAGYSRPAPLFTPDAAALVARYSAGNPRSINSLCAEALSTAAKDKREQVGAEMVRGAAVTLELIQPRPESTPAPSFRGLAAPPVAKSADSPPSVRTQTGAQVRSQRPEPAAALASPPVPQPQESATKSVASRELPARVAEEQAKPNERALPAPMKLLAPVNVPVREQEVAAKVERPATVLSVPQQLPATHPPIAPEIKEMPAPARPSLPKQGFELESGLGDRSHPAPPTPLPLAPMSWRSAQLPSSPLRLRRPSFTLRSPALYPSKGLAIACALLLAVMGAAFGVHRADTVPLPVKQTQLALPLPQSAPLIEREHKRAVPSAELKAAPKSPVHNLKGMDIATALRALSAKAQRQQQKQDTAPWALEAR